MQFVLLVLCLISCTHASLQEKRHQAVAMQTRSQPQTWYAVKKIVDGDTFWVHDGTEKGLKIRFIGLDPPETRRTAKKEIGFYSHEATELLRRLIEGREVRLEYDVRQFDRYGRTLAYVFLRDGTFVNAVLLKQGAAVLMTTPPNVKYVDEFVRLQSMARQNRAGLWNYTYQ